MMRPLCITMRKSDSSAIRGSCVTKMNILRCWRSNCTARVRWMPAFSTSSSNTTGVLQITVASAINSARVWPPESSVMRLSRSIASPVNWLAKSIAFGHQLLGFAPRRADPRMRHQELADRQIGEERGVLRDQRDRIFRGIIAEILRRRLAVDENPPPAGRVAVGEQFDVVDERGLAGAGRPDDAHDLPHRQVEPSERFGLPFLAVAAENGNGFDHN